MAVVEAGSISRAATTVHVAQPALSQQIADLEERIGVQLLLRTPRGVKATSAGETLFREASLILHRMDKLPGMLKSAIGETQGTVRLGIVASLAGPLVGVIVEHFKSELPQVNLICSDGDSGSLVARVQSHALDLALVFEDELVLGALADADLFPAAFPDRQGCREVQEAARLARGTRWHTPGFARRATQPASADQSGFCRAQACSDNRGGGRQFVERAVCGSRRCRQHHPQRRRKLPAGLESFPRRCPSSRRCFMTCCAIFSNDTALSAATEAVRASLIKVVKEFITTTKRRGAKVID